MYNNQSLIKSRLEAACLNQFGEMFNNTLDRLINSLTGKDGSIDEILIFKLQNFLALNPIEAKTLLHIALEISPVSPIASLLLIEKIPALSFYQLIDAIGEFILNIKNYGGRALALFLGSELTNTLRVEDLVDVLEQTSVNFYRELLRLVNQKHAELMVCAALIMRFGAKIESVIQLKKIECYLTICTSLIFKYGTKITEQFIRHSHVFIKWVPLENILETADIFANKSPLYLEFAFRFPDVFFKNSFFDEVLETNPKALKIRLLKSENYLKFLSSKILYEDNDYTSLMINWSNLSSTTKANILFQLEQDNYKNFLISLHPEITDIFNDQTGSRWFSPWLYCKETIDLPWLRKRLKTLLQDQNFTVPVKSMIKNHEEIFDRSNSQYDQNRLSKMIDILSDYSNKPRVSEELSAMATFIKGNDRPLTDLLSNEALVIRSWERNPWVDYGRSDEFFSCTSLGDYNASNAPAFLADFNLTNLDLYANEKRIGRVRLCLVKDEEQKTLLLVDCVDGSERALSSQQKFEWVMDAILDYANWLGIAKIKFNYEVDFNATPKRFIGYVKKRFSKSESIDYISRFLPRIPGERMPYPCQTFLESFVKNTGAFVRGACIHVNGLTIKKECLVDCHAL